MNVSDGLLLVITLVVSWAGSLWLASSRNPLRIMNQPNERSLHGEPTASLGGVAILFSLLVGWGWAGIVRDMPEAISNALIPLAIVSAISLLDDWRDISPISRLLAQGLAATWILLTMTDEWFILLMAWFAIVWFINLYNFMDGIDGLAAGMALIGFGALGLIAYLNGHQLYALYAWVVAAAASGFLVINWPPAKIFMGDVGSASLGLLVAIFWLWGIQDKVFSMWLPLLIFSPFIIDATATLFLRGCRGERVWKAHCSHFYQRLTQLGWGHRKTVLYEYILMIICAATAILLNEISDMLMVFLVVAGLSLLYLACAFAVIYFERTGSDCA